MDRNTKDGVKKEKWQTNKQTQWKPMNGQKEERLIDRKEKGRKKKERLL